MNIYPAASVGYTNWGSFYPFNSGAQDASNLYNGTLQNGASIVNDLARGNVLNLSGSSQYVSLPPGASSAQTVSGWVKWFGGSEWSRIFDFGQNNQDYFFLTPADGSNLVQCSITTDIGIYNQQIESPAMFPINQWTYFAVVMDGRQGILYLNGSAVAVNNSVNLLPSDIGATNCYFGRSQYPSDPYFYGRMDSLSLNSGALPINQLIAPISTITLPTNGTRFVGGASISFAGSATDFAGNQLPASAFSWSGALNTNGNASTVFGPLNGVTSGSYAISTNGPYSTNAFYGITLTVTDTNGNQQSVQATVPAQVELLTLTTVPAGLEVSLDSQLLTGPTALLEVAGMNHTVAAPSPQSLGSTNYGFVLWSDGGTVSHSRLMPASNLVLTASFVEPTLTATFGSSGLNLSWPGWGGSLGLYSATNLMTPVTWTPVTNNPVLSNGTLSVILQTPNAAEFYRLRSE